MRSILTKFRFLFIYFFTIILMLACSYTLTEEEKTFLESAETYIIDTFPEEIPVYVYRFVNINSNEDVQYLEKAIPDMLMSYLEPLELDYAQVDFYEFEFEMSDNFKDHVLVSNSMFSNYISNKLELTTNYTYEFSTNSNFMNLIYADDDDETNYWEELWDITTNVTDTNITMTNVDYIPDANYLTLITNEFPDLTNSLSSLSVVLYNEYTNDFVLSNIEKMTYSIYGDYEVDYNPYGPSEVLVNLYIAEFLTSTNTNIITNSITVTEDVLSYRIADFLKMIRKQILNRPSGDLYLTTIPDNASVYLDGVFIGKTPIFYPEVSEGIHQFTFMKDDYLRTILEGEVITNYTNVIHYDLEQKDSGGIIKIDSELTNSMIFMDAEFQGASPFVLSNITLNEKHRLMIQPMEDDLYPYYYTFQLTNSNQILALNPVFLDYEGKPLSRKKTAWWLAYGNWGLMIAFLGAHVYTDSRAQYYSDLNEVYAGQYESKRIDMQDMANTFLYLTVIETLVAAGFTSYALSQEEIFMGLVPTTDSTMAAIQFSF